MNVGDLNKVWEIRALKRRPNNEEATKILDRIAKQVQPIMRKHKWRVKVLSEMCPKRMELLGLNVGKGIEVKLRLRRPNRELEFLPYDQVLDTMLHELCHNDHGPHNASFYKLWDDLRKECEELIAKGISGTGEGFDCPGQRLGGFSRQPALSSLRKTALAAAENRQRHNSLLPSGALRVGGDKTIMSALSPIQAAAMAAERRLQDEIWCASASAGLDVVVEETESDILERETASSSASNSEKSRAATAVPRKRNPEPVHNLIDLTDDVNSDAHGFCDLGLNKKVRGSNDGYLEPLITGSSSDNSKYSESASWTCEVCTLINPPLSLVCEACESLKPKDASMKYKHWACKFCTLENSISLEKCSACGQWRYSHGPPLSALPPNLGT